MFDFTLHATSGLARAGSLTLPHGTVETPAFMPVGTHGTVRGLHPEEVRRAGAQIILGNTYHLHLRPGEAVVRSLGGLHRFTTWDRPMLTDSGGFQVFSLEGLRKIEEHGVEFVSHIDGSTRTLTPESSMEIQWDLGADVAMVFDHVVPGQAPWPLAEEGMERTLRWLERCRKRHDELVEDGEGRTGGPADRTTRPPLRDRAPLGRANGRPGREGALQGPSARPPNPLAHHPGRHSRRPADALTRRNAGPRAVDRDCHRRAVGG